MTPTLEQIARETAAQYHQAKRKAKKTGHITSLIPFILAALQTATKQPQGADWAEAAAEEITERASYSFNRYIPTADLAAIIRKHAPQGILLPRGVTDMPADAYLPSPEDQEAKQKFVDDQFRQHAPLVANREDSERDSKRLDWLEKHAEDLFRDRAPDANGGWFCIRETSPQSKDKPLGEFVCKSGNTLRAAIDAAMRPAQPERGQGEGTS